MGDNNMKILNFGSCNIDYVYSMNHIVKIGETEATEKMSVFPGGKGLNQSIALAKAGACVYHAGCIGNDAAFLLDILRDAKVNTSYIKQVEEKNGHAIIQVDQNGDNSIFLYPGSNAMISAEQIDGVLADFSAGDILLLQNEISNIDYLIKQAHQKGMYIIFNPSPCSGSVFSLDYSMVACLILNEVEAQSISKCENPEDALLYFASQYPQLSVMLTLGSNGCVYQSQNQRIYQPCFPVEAVDTTAAGDTFTGYFVAGIAKRTPYPELLELASCASAIAVSRKGAAPSIPYREEVTEFLKACKKSNCDK